MKKRWAIGRVPTGSEGKIAARCQEIGVEAYCPHTRQKGPRRRTDGTREAIERPALPGYLPISAATVEAPETKDKLYRENEFYGFLRDIDNVIALIRDEELDPLRSMERNEPVKFIAGPVFYIGEMVKIPYNSNHVPKCFWSREGIVVGVKNGRYCLGGEDFPIETWFTGQQLLANS